jgi:hypothetical protein
MTAAPSAETAALAPVRNVLSEMAEIDGFLAFDAGSRTIVRNPHRHHPSDSGLVEIRQPGDLDRLLDVMRSCIWSSCREHAAMADGGAA